MTNSKSTKKALLTSVLALVLCFTMLLGTTFAWFTDSVASEGNIIKAGKLDVELYKWNSATEADALSKLAENGESTAVFADVKWEPGMTEVVYFSIKNEGNLALKYKVLLDVACNTTPNLTDVMEYVITRDAKYGDVTAWDNTNAVKTVPGINNTEAVEVELLPGAENFFALSVHMLEDAGNAYQEGKITFDIKVLAAQKNYENDSFNSDYDKYAPFKGTTEATKSESAATELNIYGDDMANKDASALVPAGAVADTAEKLVFSVNESSYNGNFTVADGLEKVVYDVNVTGLKENNDVDVVVSLRLPAGIDHRTVKVYHYDEVVTNAVYNPHNGMVTFSTATFSPFTIVYDAESTAMVDATGATLPAAKVFEVSEYVGKEIVWGSYGTWSPTKGKEAVLDVAYTFSAIETAEEAANSPFANWYCDFYVSVDKDLGQDQLFLGGNYGEFGWIGFHNKDYTPEAGKEVPMIGTAAAQAWTYLKIVQNVGTFVCGAGDVDGSLEGATITVSLRLTNPTNANEYYDVQVITFTF